MRTLEYAVGDVHGQLTHLNKMIDAIDRDAAARGVEARLILLGDYVDRGPNGRGVIERLVRLETERDVVCLRGNHEQLLLDALDSFERHGTTRTNEVRNWAVNGGNATLDSYDIAENLEDFPVDHRTWLRNLSYACSTEHRLYVHAGVTPGFELRQQTSESLLWIRERFLRVTNPADLCAPFVVHGHTPYWDCKPNAEDVEITPVRCNLDTGAFFTGWLSCGVFDPELPGGPIDTIQVYDVPVERDTRRRSPGGVWI